MSRARRTSAMDHRVWRAREVSTARFAARPVVVPVDDSRVVDAPFQPCGGVLDGRWDLVSTTGTAAQLGRVVWISRAPDPRAACGIGEHFEDEPFTVSGRVTFSPAGQSSEDGLGAAQVFEGLEVRRDTLTTLDCLRSVGKSCSNADFSGREAWMLRLPERLGAAFSRAVTASTVVACNSRIAHEM